MGSKLKIRTSKVLKGLLVFLVLLFSILFYFREPIKEHNVTKAKMEMFRRMIKSEPEQWGEEMQVVIDSMIINPRDSVGDPVNE